jgi:hypothetical protein
MIVERAKTLPEKYGSDHRHRPEDHSPEIAFERLIPPARLQPAPSGATFM